LVKIWSRRTPDMHLRFENEQEFKEWTKCSYAHVVFKSKGYALVVIQGLLIECSWSDKNAAEKYTRST